MFDDCYVYVCIGFFYCCVGIFVLQCVVNGGWIWGGYLFLDGVSVWVFGIVLMINNVEWLGFVCFMNGSNVSFYYIVMLFNCLVFGGVDIMLLQVIIMCVDGYIYVDDKYVWFIGFDDYKVLLELDGYYYQIGQQNIYFLFCDLFVFIDFVYLGKIYMVFEGNIGGLCGVCICIDVDFGYVLNDLNCEDFNVVMNLGVVY